jgi:hypothetical protein
MKVKTTLLTTITNFKRMFKHWLQWLLKRRQKTTLKRRYFFCPQTSFRLSRLSTSVVRLDSNAWPKRRTARPSPGDNDNKLSFLFVTDGDKLDRFNTSLIFTSKAKNQSGTTKGGSITVLLISCLTGLD